MARWIASSIGVTSCTAAAGLSIPVFGETEFRTFLPFLFLTVIVFVAIRFGKIAGVLGTVAAALIFAFFLFEPTLSFAVRNSAAKSHLIWMLLIGIILSDLLGAYTIGGSGTRNRV